MIIITSNNEKELPDAFLRRCFFHFINFPDKLTMKEIVNVHFPNLQKKLVQDALEIFFKIREMPGLKKRPSTSELIDWLKLLVSDDIPDDILANHDPSKAIPPLYGALIKNEQDVQLLERLAFMHRRETAGKTKNLFLYMLLSYFDILRRYELPITIGEFLDFLGALELSDFFADKENFIFYPEQF